MNEENKVETLDDAPVVETLDSVSTPETLDEPATEAPAPVVIESEAAQPEPVTEAATEAPKVEEAPTEPVTEAPKEEPTTEAPAPAKTKKKGKGGVLLILLILVIIIFVVWFFVLGGNEMLGFKSAEPEQGNTNNTPQDPEPNKKLKELDINSDEVTKAMENFSLIDVSDDELTKNASYNVSSLSFKQKVDTMGKKVDDTHVAACGNPFGEELTLEQINEFLATVLDASFTKEEIESNGVEDSFTTIENDTINGLKVDGTALYSIWVIDGKYYVRLNICDGLGKNDVVYKKVVKAEKDDNNLYVYEKRAFYEIGKIVSDSEADGMPVVEINYYKDSAKTELIETLQGIHVTVLNPYYEQKNEITWDKYDTYKYTFKIKDGNYYFEKFEKAK